MVGKQPGSQLPTARTVRLNCRSICTIGRRNDRVHHASQSSPLPLVEYEKLCVSVAVGWEKKRKGSKEGKEKNLYLAIHKCFHSKILCEEGESPSTNWIQVPYWCRYYSESTRGDSIKCRTLTIVIVVKSVWGFDFCDWPLVGFQMLFFSSSLQRIG